MHVIFALRRFSQYFGIYHSHIFVWGRLKSSKIFADNADGGLITHTHAHLERITDTFSAVFFFFVSYAQGLIHNTLHFFDLIFMGQVSVHRFAGKHDCRMLAGNLRQTSIFFWHLFLWQLSEISRDLCVCCSLFFSLVSIF